MKHLTPGISLDQFFADVARARSRLLMLDYDGTLAPFQKDRTEAYPYPGVRERLTQLHADPRTRLVIVSGRAIQDLKPLLGLESFPEMWGSHGAERYIPGEGIQPPDLSPSTQKGLDDIETWIAEHELSEVAEKKPTSFAFHYRTLDPDEKIRIRDAVKSAWANEIDTSGLELHEFDGGIELRAAGISKADAVEKALAESPGAAAAYLGDDITDEDAFRALEGNGLRVLVRPEFRQTDADIHLVPPEELLYFLDRWLIAGTGNR